MEEATCLIDQHSKIRVNSIGGYMSESVKRPGTGHNLTVAIGAAVGAAAGATPALAEDQRLEEIIVTAKKRDMNLQDTAIAITAITDEQITLHRFENFQDYAGQIPGLAFSDRQPGAKSVIMRGCAAQGLSFSDSATTSVYLDEQPITYSGYNPDPRLVDVARIEALSGPQGTLFGDAAQCGTLRIITNKPDPSVQDGWVDLTAYTVADGDVGYDISGMTNVPLADDKVALRLVGFYASDAGWIDNVLSPSPGGQFDNADRVKDDVNSSVWYGGRASLRILPGENWTVDLTGIYQYYELDGFGDASLNIGHYADTSVYPTFDHDEQARFTEDYWEDEWYQFATTIEGNLEAGDLVFTANYFERDSVYFADATAYLQSYQLRGDYFRSFYTYYGPTIYDFGGDPLANDYDGRTTTTWAVETRFATPQEGRWSAIVGAFYSQIEVDELFISNVFGMTGTDAFAYINYAGNYFYGAPLKAESNNWFSGTYDSEIEQWAIFGEVNVDLTEHFQLTAGGRYYEISRDYTVTNAALVGLNGGPPNCFNSGNPEAPNPSGTDYCYAPGLGGESDENGFVPKVTISYQLDDKMFYATYSEGFRRGGANSARPQSVFGTPSALFPPPAGTLNSYESDELINTEIGAKTEWLDDTLRFNFAIYRMIWDNIQVQAEDAATQVFSLGIVNFPEAEIEGVEAWLSWLPSENLSIEATFGYNKGELSKEETLFEGFEGSLTVPKGTRLPIVPDYKASLNVMYSFNEPIMGGYPYVMARYTHTGDSVNSLAGIESSPFLSPVREQESWATIDLQAGLEADTWDLSLYVDNLTDEEAELFYNNRFAQQRLSVNAPRSIGVYFRYKFGG